MNDLKAKVKKFGPKEIKLADDKSYMIKKENDEDLTFKDENEEKDVKVNIKPKDKDDKEYKEYTLKVKYDGSWYSDGVKVSSKDIGGGMTVKLREEKDVNFGVKGFKNMFWVVVFSIIIVFAGLL